MTEHKRQTGRTTRMIEHATNLAKAGKKVTVYFLTKEQIDALSNTNHGMYALAAGVIFKEHNTLSGSILYSLYSPDFDGPVLFDHEVINFEYRNIIELYEQFDEKWFPIAEVPPPPYEFVQLYSPRYAAGPGINKKGVMQGTFKPASDGLPEEFCDDYGIKVSWDFTHWRPITRPLI